VRKNRKGTVAAVVAALLVLAVYLIPHSVFGSELDHTSTPAAPDSVQ